MAMKVSVWSVSLIVWVVCAARYAYDAQLDLKHISGSDLFWTCIATLCACAQGAIGMWLLATKLHGPVSSGLQGASHSHHPSCLPTSALDYFRSSCFPTLFQHGGLHATANGLPLKGLEVFHQSCVQRCLRHHNSGLNTASLPTTALDLFHFSVMRRLLHNSGKCLMPEAALDLFAGSLIQQAMVSDLRTSFQSPSPKGVAPVTDADVMQSTEPLADGSTTDQTEPNVAARSSFSANAWSSAVQHSPPSHEADANVASSTHVSCEESSNDFAYGRPNFLFTSVPMLGPPVQPHDDPIAPNTAADAESDEGSVQSGAAQSCDKFVKMSIVTASAKKRTLKTLTSNSLSLAAAIQEAGEATAGPTAPDPDDLVSLKKKVSLRRMGSSIKEFAIKAFQGPERERLLA